MSDFHGMCWKDSWLTVKVALRSLFFQLYILIVNTLQSGKQQPNATTGKGETNAYFGKTTKKSSSIQ